MSQFKIIVPAAIVLGGFLVCSTASYGKPEYTKQTKKACVFCHVDRRKAPKESEGRRQVLPGAQEPGRLPGEEVAAWKVEAGSRP